MFLYYAKSMVTLGVPQPHFAPNPSLYWEKPYLFAYDKMGQQELLKLPTNGTITASITVYCLTFNL